MSADYYVCHYRWGHRVQKCIFFILILYWVSPTDRITKGLKYATSCALAVHKGISSIYLSIVVDASLVVKLSIPLLHMTGASAAKNIKMSGNCYCDQITRNANFVAFKPCDIFSQYELRYIERRFRSQNWIVISYKVHINIVPTVFPKIDDEIWLQ